MKKEEYVTASEIGDYIFCHRGWWLRFNGKLPKTQAMIEGTAAHEELAEDLQSFDRKKAIAWVLVGMGILLIILYFLVSILI